MLKPECFMVESGNLPTVMYSVSLKGYFENGSVMRCLKLLVFVQKCLNRIHYSVFMSYNNIVFSILHVFLQSVIYHDVA
jgi:hypothetical protein